MRLDIFLFENGLADSRSKATELIKRGSVIIKGKPIVKPSFEIDDKVSVHEICVEKPRYVSRGGIKLEKALDFFGINVEGLTAVDFGASTGGFTDCLLQNGAKKVYAIDSGSNQLDAKLLNNSSVISLENTNARYIDFSEIGEKCDIAVCDLSFISQTLLHYKIAEFMKKDGVFISLIKPQFEVGKQYVGKGGIVKNDKAVKAAINNVIASAERCGFSFVRITESPIKGKDGNTEYLACFRFKDEGHIAPHSAVM